MPRRLRLAAAALVAAAALAAPVARADAAPVVEESWATGVAATAVDLHAVVDPGGLATYAKIEYISAAAYQANLGAVPPRDGFVGATSTPAAGLALGAGTTGVAFSRHVGFLTPSTAYRYRVSATSSTAIFGPVQSFTTSENAPVFSLPDGRAWEMVSPVEKNGGEIQRRGEIFGGGVFQAAAEGGAVSFSSRTSFGDAQAASIASQYIARRGADGWVTQNVTTPALAGAFGDSPDGVPYQLFSGDLSRGLILAPQRCGAAPCPRGYDLRGADGALVGSVEEPDLRFAGASADLGTVILASCAALAPGAIEISTGPGECDPGAPNLYAWSGGGLTLINVLPGTAIGLPGAALAAQDAVSADGRRVYFTDAGDLYLREAGRSVQVDAAVGGGGSFEATDADGGLAFFTKAGHLYRFDATLGSSADLTPGGEVEGVLGASPDGAYVYYVTPAGLFLAHGGATTKVAAGADPANYPPATGSGRIAANGNLAFVSSARLGEYDNGGLAEAYVYAPASATLTCASCNPTGARPIGPASIPGAAANGVGPSATRIYKPRAFSAAGTRLFFESRDALAPLDTNSDFDVYEWEASGTGSCAQSGGCIAPISSGRSTDGASFLDASADGSDVFFLTDASLVPTDPGVVDVYDARIGGGFPVPVAPIACIADACQAVPLPPEDPTPATTFVRGGNPPIGSHKAKKKKRKHGKRHHKAHRGHGRHATHGKKHRGKRGGNGRRHKRGGTARGGHR